MRMKLFIVLIAILTLSMISTAIAQGQKGPVGPPLGPAAAPAELLVRFKTDASKTAINQVHAALGAHVLRTFQIVPNLQLVRVPSSMSLAEARASYEKDPTVLYAEPNYVYHLAQHVALTPDDERFAELWALHNTGQTGGTEDADIDAPEAWDLSTGSSSVVVATIDSGIDYTHPDLTNNMWRNTPDCNSNNIDDDGNGYKDDCHGVDMVNNDSDPKDDHNHGTHVAGIIGAKGNNAVGVVGVNWNVQIMACKFLNASGFGFTSDAIRCLEYVKLMKDRGVNIVATNNSWGGGGYSQALYDAITAHLSAGILFIAAAGNSGNNNDISSVYPASYYLPNVIAVAATDHNDNLASFTTGGSNYGAHTVHVGAPGKSILSTTRNNTYSTFGGTSMAAPHVTGLAALLKAHNPSWDWIALRNLILSSGDALMSLQGKTVTERRINAYQALTCTDAPLFAVLRPIQTLLGGAAMTIAVLNINCATPAGALTVTINPIGTTLTLEDNGVAPDLAANDGIYSAAWIEPCAVGNTFTLDFSNGESLTVEIAGSVGIYRCTTPPMSWRTFTGTMLNLSDDSSARINSPFPIKFGTAIYSSLYVGANGAISFHQMNFPHTNGSLPNSSFTTLIAPFWDDLYPLPRSKHNVFWTVRGTAPNRELVIEWRNVWHF
ncbi:MAG: S8 family serine peptidase, partial [Candidatus Bipolaricaulota bacterium]|nr:S8 family serine peptidase [Candidatus Bipolaricaulota bacterium]